MRKQKALRRYFTKREEPAWIAPEMRRRSETLKRGEYGEEMIGGDVFLAELERHYP